MPIDNVLKNPGNPEPLNPAIQVANIIDLLEAGDGVSRIAGIGSLQTALGRIKLTDVVHLLDIGLKTLDRYGVRQTLFERAKRERAEDLTDATLYDTLCALCARGFAGPDGFTVNNGTFVSPYEGGHE